MADVFSQERLKKKTERHIQSKTEVNSILNMDTEITLADTEQPTIIIKSEYYHNGEKFVSDQRNFRVTHLIYEFDVLSIRNELYPTPDVYRFTGIRGIYYLKGNKELGVREHTFRHITKEMVEQIPDELHEHARKDLQNYLISGT